MNLLNAKDCAKCANSIVYGSKDNCTIHCTSLNSIIQDNFKENGRFCAAYCEGYIKADKHRSGIIDEKYALEFMLAGKSEFIMHSTKTEDDFRFRLRAEKANFDDKKIIYFINSIKGNEDIYCGILYFDDKNNEFKFSQGNKGKMTDQSVDIRSLLFVINKLYNKEAVGSLETYNVGLCGRCGKPIIESEDIDRGLHEECANTNMYKSYYCK